MLICLNAMRVGLLTRFMGVLGIITGALQILPLGGPLPVVQCFWLLMLEHPVPRPLAERHAAGVADRRRASRGRARREHAPARGSAPRPSARGEAAEPEPEPVGAAAVAECLGAQAQAQAAH